MKRKFFNEFDQFLIAHITPCKTCSTPSFSHENAVQITEEDHELREKNAGVKWLNSERLPAERGYERELGRVACEACGYIPENHPERWDRVS